MSARTTRWAIERTGVQSCVEVDPAQALEVFYDPFAYESGRADDACVAA